MRKEIEALKKETGSSPDSSERSKQLTKLKADLATLREKYSDDHPDVVKLTKSIAALAHQPSDGVAVTNVKPENPAYITLKAQLEGTLSELKSSRAKRTALQSKIASYEQRLEQTPQVEREYLDLTRDQEATMARYKEIRAKQMQAQIGQELEKDRKGERFSLIDPPQIPEQPVSPNRAAIVLLGVVLSVGGGLGSATVFESLDQSVREARTLARLSHVPVLGMIPYLHTDRELLRDHWRVYVALILLAALIVAAALAIHFLWIPLDVVWYRTLRWIQAGVPF
jgi:uncharacterized protein involved in exopolysaccharide biosynthesis